MLKYNIFNGLQCQENDAITVIPWGEKKSLYQKSIQFIQRPFIDYKIHPN